MDTIVSDLSAFGFGFSFLGFSIAKPGTSCLIKVPLVVLLPSFHSPGPQRTKRPLNCLANSMAVSGWLDSAEGGFLQGFHWTATLASSPASIAIPSATSRGTSSFTTSK